MPAHMTLAKPRKGSARAMQRARRRLVEVRERAAKDAAKARDGYTCRRCHGAMLQGPLLRHMEAAHIRNAGSGGNPNGSRGNTAACYVTLCADCHRGPRSVHSGHVRIVAGPRGGDGPVEFVNVETPGQRLLHIRVEHDA